MNGTEANQGGESRGKRAANAFAIKEARREILHTSYTYLPCFPTDSQANTEYSSQLLHCCRMKYQHFTSCGNIAWTSVAHVKILSEAGFCRERSRTHDFTTSDSSFRHKSQYSRVRRDVVSIRRNTQDSGHTMGAKLKDKLLAAKPEQRPMKSAPRLDALPSELLIDIAEHVPRADLPAFCRTSKQLQAIATPLLYETVILRPGTFKGPDSLGVGLLNPKNAGQLAKFLDTHTRNTDGRGQVFLTSAP